MVQPTEFVRRLWPVRGWFAWELQCGPVVFQWLHNQSTASYLHVRGSKLGRLLVWRDPMWRC